MAAIYFKTARGLIRMGRDRTSVSQPNRPAGLRRIVELMERERFTRDAAGAINSCPKGRLGLPLINPRSVFAIDVQAVRLAARVIGSTQQTFADAIGVSVKTLRNWEQRRRKPTGPALILLKMIQRDPRIVLNVLGGSNQAGF